MITSYEAYKYCESVEDNQCMMDKITGGYACWLYCKNIQNRPEMRDKVNCTKYARHLRLTDKFNLYWRI